MYVVAIKKGTLSSGAFETSLGLKSTNKDTE